MALSPLAVLALVSGCEHLVQKNSEPGSGRPVSKVRIGCLTLCRTLANNKSRQMIDNTFQQFLLNGDGFATLLVKKSSMDVLNGSLEREWGSWSGVRRFTGKGAVL